MIRVLVVDDDFRVARIHRGFVERVDGFDVVGTAHTGAEALAAVTEHQPDLILLDLYLPDAFGLDLVPQLRAAGHDCDVMVITAAKEVESVRAAVRHGVVNYLLKPFSFGDLRGRLEQYAVERLHLDAAVVSGQDDIDRVLGQVSRGGHAGGSAAAALPKGMSVETGQLVAQVLRESSETMSASEAAERTGLSRVSARRYLEHFVTTGRAEVSLRYGTTGRPERRYRWTA